VSVGIVYVALLVLGVAYALISGALGWLSDLGDGGDIHVDASGHLDAGHAHPVSGTTIATFVTGFGAGGIVGHYLLRWTLLPGLALATVTGVALAGAAYVVLELIFRQTQAGSEYAVGETIGREAEVITAIPAGGTGEVAFIVRGQREIAPARLLDGGALARGRVAVIDKVMGHTLYVRPKA
jgi:hypothetical protein